MNYKQKQLFNEYMITTYKALNRITFENKDLAAIDKKQNELLKINLDNLEDLIEDIIKLGK